MNPETESVFQNVFTVLFLVTLFAGGYLVLNFQRYLGVDPEMPSETSSSRSYTRMQALVVWLHAVLLTGGFALLMH
ncbi:MAG: hypothetical protein ABIP20_01070 [Chthoniobacteraceae bacterium]